LQAAEGRPERQDFSDLFRVAASTDQKIIIPWRVIDGRRRRRRRSEIRKTRSAAPRALDLGRDQFRDAAVRRKIRIGLRR